MPSTTGRVQQLNWTSPASVSVVIETSPNAAATFIINFNAADSAAIHAFKKSMVHLLAEAKANDRPATIRHNQQSSTPYAAELAGLDITLIGNPIHNDFFGVSGQGIPAAAQLVFETASTVVRVAPDLVRPHWIFVAELPPSIPLGPNTLRLEAPGWQSDDIPVDVSPGPPETVRVLFPGGPKSRPYTIVFVANPAVETLNAGEFLADYVLSDRSVYHKAIAGCLRPLLTQAEDILHQANLDAQIRFVSIFDETLAVSDENALGQQLLPNKIAARQQQIASFVARYRTSADIVFLIHGQAAFATANARYSVDEGLFDTPTTPGTPYAYDDTVPTRTHGHFVRLPGVASLERGPWLGSITPGTLHEFVHAASDLNNGAITDLYHDDLSPVFVINKKWRASPTDPVPSDFATYNGIVYQSDPMRDNIGYPSDWTSYHPELIDPSQPNLMDVGGHRLDRLTYDWLSDRLRAKIFR